LNETVHLSTAKYKTKFVMKEWPAQIKVPEHLCKVIVNW
jgi:hypothetical protein